jgi:hypothetical protein
MQSKYSRQLDALLEDFFIGVSERYLLSGTVLISATSVPSA